MPVSGEQLGDRLRARRPEIEGAQLARTTSLPDTTLCDEPEYLAGYRSAIFAGFEYGVAVAEEPNGELPPIPAPLLAQTRRAARNSVGIQTVIRRYTVATGLFKSFVLEEIDPSQFESVHNALAEALNALQAAVSREYEEERARRSRSSEAVKLERVRKALNGGPVDAARLEYALDLRHVALIAKGSGAPNSLGVLAKQVDCRLLCVRVDEETAWAWLGRRQEIGTGKLAAALSDLWDPNMPVAVSEECTGPAGWRESHRQAQDVLLVALRGTSPIAHYHRDGMLAALFANEPLASMLWSRFIAPILSVGAQGLAYLWSLRAYLDSKRNGEAASKVVGVRRQTIAKHLSTIEELIGLEISGAGPELELALRLHEAGFRPPAHESILSAARQAV